MTPGVDPTLRSSRPSRSTPASRPDAWLSDRLGRAALIGWTVLLVAWLVAGAPGGLLGVGVWGLIVGYAALPWAGRAPAAHLEALGLLYLLAIGGALFFGGVSLLLDGVRSESGLAALGAVLSALCVVFALFLGLWLVGVWFTMSLALAGLPRASLSCELARALIVALLPALPVGLLGASLGPRLVRPGSAPGGLPSIDPALSGALSGGLACVLVALLLRLRMTTEAQGEADLEADLEAGVEGGRPA